MECGVVGQHYETPYFHPRYRHPPSWNDPSVNSAGSASTSALVSGVPALLVQMWCGCECGAEEQTVDHYVHQWPIHQPSHGLHRLTVLYDETIEWLLKTWSSGQAVDSNNSLKRRGRSTQQTKRSWNFWCILIINYAYSMQMSDDAVDIMARGVTNGVKGAPFPGCRVTVGGTEKSQQCHKCFLQYSAFASERPQFRTREHQTCFLPQAPSNLVASLVMALQTCRGF